MSGDLGELAARVADWWEQVQEALEAWPDGSDAVQLAAIETLASLGLQGVAFDTPAGAGALLRERWAGVTLPASAPPAVSSDEAVAWLAGLRAHLSSASGGWVLAAPLWTAADAGWTALGGEAPGGPAIGTDAVDDWLNEHRDACPGVTQLLDALNVVGACGAGREAWVLRQHRPAPPGTELPAGWVAIDHPGPRSATHLAVLQIGAPAGDQRSVVIVDRWLETMPVQPTDDVTRIPVESASLAFRFDRPDARAPNAVLLAVPPDLDRGWCMEDVQATVEETLWWAQARPLDADDLPELQWVLA